MRLERRKVQDVARAGETPYRLGAEYMEGTYTDLIASRSKRRRKEPLNNLMPFFSVDNLRQAYCEISGSKAMGSDGITKEKYGEDLERNLQDLHYRMRRLSYRPADAKLVLIPKADGTKRPIAISNFEDKLVQKVAADILTAIYDRDFHRFSFGFRPERSCHGAIAYLYNKLRYHNLPWVVDVDLKSFFNTIDHKRLIEVLRKRVADRRLLQYISRMLKAGILVEGESLKPEAGTPQGSIVSPILANVYLHHVVDEWFIKTIRPRTGGEMVRYADDIVAAFPSEDKAKKFIKSLEERLRIFGLSLNRDKTRVVHFDQKAPERRTFDFLGFTFYWGHTGINHRVVLKVKTSMKTLKKKILDFVYWIKANRSRYRLEVLWEKAIQKLQGHYNYYGVLWNRRKLLHFYQAVVESLLRWLNRRSQKKSYTLEGFQMRLRSKPLVLPPEGPRLLNLTRPRLYCWT